MIRRLLARLAGVDALSAQVRQQLRTLDGRQARDIEGALRAVDALAERAKRAEDKLAAALDREQARVTATAERLKTQGEKLQEAVATITRLEERLRQLESPYAPSDEDGHVERRLRRLECLTDANDRSLPLLRRAVHMLSNLEPVKARVREAVSRATFHRDPSAHVVIDDLLPADFYELLVDSMPPAALFEPIDRVKADFRPFDGPSATLVSRLVWQTFEQDLVDGVLRETLLDRFRPVLEPHYARLVGDDVAAEAASLPMRAAGRLMRRVPGYRLGPHLDPKRVLITGLLYCARPGDSEEYGTSLYRVNRPFVAPFLKTYYPREDGLECTVVKTISFTANRFIAFINADAAHGAELPRDAAQQDRYAYQFYIQPDADRFDDLLRRVPAEIQALWQEPRTQETTGTTY
jgi:hypothetical protein